jgi:hypothetical protein
VSFLSVIRVRVGFTCICEEYDGCRKNECRVL